MRKPGTDENNVRMSDVLCDFCHSQWTEDVPMIEGHQGSCICGRCLGVAYSQVVISDINSAPTQFKCRMCLEAAADRRALGRDGDPGWQSPIDDQAVVCRRCIKLASGALHKDKDFAWTKPAE